MSLELFSKQAGEHLLMHQGIEIALSIPQGVRYDYVAIVAHPHPLHHGTMMNKVVTTTAKAIFNQSIPVLRFNFRGVGQSIGHFDHGIGETQDLLLLIQAWQGLYPKARVLLSGFSFGSYVAYRAAQVTGVAGLLLIAPPVFRFSFELNHVNRVPDAIIMGRNDEVVEAKEVLQFANSFTPAIPTFWFEETGHFFHGKLLELRDAVSQWVQTCLSHA